VRGLHWPARRASTSPVPGAHAATRRGVSPEFTEYRRYSQGDDPRTLDWRLLARSDRAYVRVATDRANLSTTLLLDASASMAYPLLTRAKWETAVRVATGLAAVARAEGDPVGLLVPREYEPPIELAARSRRGVIPEMMRRLAEVDPDGSAPLAPALALVRTRRVALITDLLGDADEMLAAARLHIARGRELHVVHVLAPEEVDPPRRTMLASDPEQPTVHRLVNASARASYVRAFAEWRDATARAWRAAGAWYTAAMSDEAPEVIVRRVVLPGAVAGSPMEAARGGAPQAEPR
jgi:uncharacterized protein (DUF58 family)